jgi:hypothetical protein
MTLLDVLVEVFEAFIRILAACMVAYIPIPTKWKNEYRCRLILEILTGMKFVSTRRLEWLINPITKRRLEIDCYCDELKLGVEYNGIQHYKNTNRFGGDLEHRVYLDTVKKKLCYQNNVTLMIIPYTVTTKHLCPYIISKLERIANLQDYCTR